MFNWFRRKLAKPEQDQKQEPSLETTPPQTPTPEADTETTNTSQEDYLNWAKTAYQNIQQRKDQSQPTETPLEETVSSDLKSEPEAEQEPATTNVTPTVEPADPKPDNVPPSPTPTETEPETDGNKVVLMLLRDVSRVKTKGLLINSIIPCRKLTVTL